ncbi:PREDICTED: cyclin-dependent kinase inhibitor 7-like [Lupinus angustifolius]|uniref:cyclin-dependent kinase inhibitor 7-like n=1 Tax=Lupinus angustifolius TaxID=3871 RepID=UPI00092F05A0|nr:PREDICTED: cyclin-dependent kinase inhibitor 7-like [Lupinus angustifolius]
MRTQIEEEGEYKALVLPRLTLKTLLTNHRHLQRIQYLLQVESAQVETSTCNYGEEIERREMSLGENFQEVEANSRRSESTAQNMPTQSELDEFFTTAEKDIQKTFQNKYNYDIVKDVPLEGRYEWVQLKP